MGESTSQQLRSLIVNRPRLRKKGARRYDAGKRVKGRKWHLVVDTMGLMLSVRVHRADNQDRDGAKMFVEQIKRHR
jgi:hypothetical protein